MVYFGWFCIDRRLDVRKVLLDAWLKTGWIGERIRAFLCGTRAGMAYLEIKMTKV